MSRGCDRDSGSPSNAPIRSVNITAQQTAVHIRNRIPTLKERHSQEQRRQMKKQNNKSNTLCINLAPLQRKSYRCARCIWRRKWQPTPVFLPGESQGWRSLVGCCLWGRAESDTIEVT